MLQCTTIVQVSFVELSFKGNQRFWIYLICIMDAQFWSSKKLNNSAWQGIVVLHWQYTIEGIFHYWKWSCLILSFLFISWPIATSWQKDISLTCLMLTKHELHAKTETEVTKMQDVTPNIRVTNSLTRKGLIQLTFKLTVFPLVSKTGIAEVQQQKKKWQLMGFFLLYFLNFWCRQNDLTQYNEVIMQNKVCSLCQFFKVCFYIHDNKYMNIRSVKLIPLEKSDQ